MSAERTVVLADFARACRTATRSVSLYPATHPSIQASLARVTASAGRLIPEADVTLTVFPDSIAIDGETPERTDPAIGELAGLMHDRLIGTLRVERGADGHDWHALLLLLARPSDELLNEGGVAKAWAASGRRHFAIHEIDDGAVSAFQVDPATGGLRFLNRVAAHGSAPCHCCVDASGSYPLRRMSLSLFCLAAELI